LAAQTCDSSGEKVSEADGNVRNPHERQLRHKEISHLPFKVATDAIGNLFTIEAEDIHVSLRACLRMVKVSSMAVPIDVAVESE